MRTGSLILALALWPVLLAAGSGRGAISGKVANPDGAIRIVATSLDPGEEFSSAADGSGEFRLAALPPGAYRVVIRNQAGTGVARHYVKVRAGATLRLDSRLEAVPPPNPSGVRARAQASTTASCSFLE